MLYSTQLMQELSNIISVIAFLTNVIFYLFIVAFIVIFKSTADIGDKVLMFIDFLNFLLLCAPIHARLAYNFL